MVGLDKESADIGDDVDEEEEVNEEPNAVVKTGTECRVCGKQIIPQLTCPFCGAVPKPRGNY